LTIVPSTTGGIQFTDVAATEKGFIKWTASTGALTLGTAATERMRINSSGNVGINNTSPGSKLTVSETTVSVYNFATIPNNAATTINYQNSYTNSVGLFVQRAANTDNWAPTIQFGQQYGNPNTTSAFITGLGLGNILFSGWNNVDSAYLVGASIKAFPSTGWATNNAPAYLSFYTHGGAATETERMRIDSSGNVGIGISSPSYKLHVYNNAAGTASFSQINDGGTALGINNFVMRNANDGDSRVTQFAAQVQNTAGNTQQAFIAAQAVTGAGVYAPSMIFGQTTGASTYTERMRIDSSGNVLVTSVGGLGYGTGSGGAVTQLTSRTTGVTLNKTNGTITMFSAAGSATAATFTVTNSTVAATDVIHLSQKSGTNLYVLLVTAVAAGSFNVTFYTTGGTATDAPVFNFAVIKAVVA
jgi:hypothetical protein